MPIVQSTVERETEVPVRQPGVRVVAGRLDVGEDAAAALSAWLSPEELARAQRCHFERDRRRYIVARARLRELLAEVLGASPETIRFEDGEHGKPMLGGRHRGSGWHFNLSRCGDLALYALSAGRRVGVDVEAVREVRGAEEIAMHCFSRRERLAWRALDPAERLLGFLNCWTRKEAFVKALGTGMSFSYDRFDVSLVPGAPACLLRLDDRPGHECAWEIEAFEPREGFVAALACERRTACSA
ncbi:MAG TPA: 4'-phosphopantetheinyl transferase superfamily protein [Rhodocyclaceae bacterium]